RIMSVEAQLLPGHEALVATLKFDGKTTGAEAAVQILAAERALNKTTAAALAADAPNPAPHALPSSAAADAAAATGAANEDAGKPIEERCKAKWDKDPAIRAEFIEFASYLAFEK